VVINIMKKEAAACYKYRSLHGVIHLKSTVQNPVIVELLKYVAILHCVYLQNI
jgi:hypothetical protein